MNSWTCCVVLFLSLCALTQSTTSQQLNQQRHGLRRGRGHQDAVEGAVDLDRDDQQQPPLESPPSQKRRKLVSEELSGQWAKLAELSHDTSRPTIVQTAISSAAGVYSDVMKSKRHGTEKTVLVNVLSFNIDNGNTRYQHLLSNWFCFANHYGFRPLTYLVPIPGKNFTEQVKDLHSIGIFGEFITYPDELFWKLVAKKRWKVSGGGGKVDYAGVLPSFEHFGALVMLVPILEVLEAGYDAIYIDLDVGFVHDPIPHLMVGKSEFSVSIEMKTCYCPSVYNISKVTDWKGQEPNTGIMRVKSSPRTIDIYYQWMQRIVDENVSNDQKVLDFIGFGARLSYDCNPQLQIHSEELLNLYNRSLVEKQQHYTAEQYEKFPKYCFLNEYLFQNGKLSLNCAKNRGGSVSEYLIAMNEMNFMIWNESTQSYEKTLAPAIAHMNMCDDKIYELQQLGLWLPSEYRNSHHHQICKPYRFAETIYGKTNYQQKLAAANEELEKIYRMLYNGSVIKLHKWPQMYMYMDGKFRHFVNGETFEALGLDWKTVHYPGPYNILKAIPAGDPLPDLKPADPPPKTI